jgi:uncharacterized membrane protein
MSLEPLLHAPLAVQIHAATVIPAFLLGTYLIFFSRKRRAAPPSARLSLSDPDDDHCCRCAVHPRDHAEESVFGLSPIHIFVPITLVSVVGALYGARRHNIPVHRGTMLGAYIGGLLIAGSLAVLPGRMMHTVAFGS